MKRPESLCAILPAYNEGPNLRDVVTELTAVLEESFERWGVLIVDDGSTDDTPRVIAELEAEDPRVTSLRLRANRGKSEALRMAFAHADTDLILLMDADGQDDPNELYRMLEELDAGSDLVTGRRSVRNDRFVKRKTSRLYNRITSGITGVEGEDFNSGYKLMRGSVADSLTIYGELHRYIPILAVWAGFVTSEVTVNHRTRLQGESKFGRNRFWRGMLDLLTVKFLTTYDHRPFHLLGGTGLVVSTLGGALLGWMLVLRIMGEAVGDRPALLTGVMLLVLGVLLVCVGLLAELIVHIDAQRRRELVERERPPGVRD